ncbi:hypothetical protein [Sphingomonas sp. BK580]|uniref:hypothetical protein n=1 Tax=Sphingomonas sp. BK580 TaxID=2586972 RepID=UPI001608656A|nr:hypothetical protein [Sphingomonas sp. BK580]MBB3693555.1 hypothetical protein [Sphingomonas sp. BK580]
MTYVGAPSHGATLPWPTDIDPELVELFKKVVWSSLVQPAERAPATRTLANQSSGMLILGRYMTEFEYYDLIDFDVTAVRFLQRNLRDLASRIDEAEYMDQGGADDDGIAAADRSTHQHQDPSATDHYTRGRLSFTVVDTVFNFIALIYRQRRVLRLLGVHVGDEDPLDGQTARSWTLGVRAPGVPAKSPLPDEIALPLMIAADRLLGAPADDVLKLQKAALRALARREVAPTRKTLRMGGTDLLDAWRFAILNGETTPWHPTLPIHDEDGGPLPLAETLRDLIETIRDACVLTLLQLTGMRIGEIVALRAGWQPEAPLPSCIVKRRSASNDRDLFYAESIVNKGRDVPERETWLLGCCAAGSKAIPTPVRAIMLLEDLLAPWRALLTVTDGSLPLIVSFYGAKTLPSQSSHVSHPTVISTSRNVRLLYSRLLEWQDLPDIAENGDELIEYKSRRGMNISCSQWRKTFAANIARTDTRLLNALRRHFKHMHLATTEGDYVGRDVRVLEDVDEAQLQQTMTFLRAQTRRPGRTIGRTGSIVQRNLKRIRLLEEAGHPQLGKDMMEVLVATDVRLLHADHGICAITVSPTKARCHELARSVSFLNDRPSFSYQRPEICAGCRCFVADQSHLPYWRTRFLQNNAAKRAHHRSPDGGPAKVFEMKARQAWRVLRSLRSRQARDVQSGQSAKSPE